MKAVVQILSFLMLTSATACITLYKSNTVHSPLLKEKGEISTTSSVGLIGCGLYNLQAAYAISNHTGIIIDGMYHNRRESNNDSSLEKLNWFLTETGAGYFSPFANNDYFLFQCYSGAGYGYSSDKMYSASQSYPEINAKSFNLFVQPGFAYTGKCVQVAFDLKGNYVHMFDINAYLYEKFEFWNTDYHFVSDTTLSFVNMEPTLTMKVGGNKLKGIFQLGLIIPTINSTSYASVSASPTDIIKISVGVNYCFYRN